MKIVHWTNRRGLLDILSSMILHEQTSFSSDFAYTIDAAHNAPYGLVFDTDDLAYAGIARLPAGTKGVTAYEMQIEWRNATQADLAKAPWLLFVVRSEAHRRALSRTLRSRGHETEQIDIEPSAKSGTWQPIEDGVYHTDCEYILVVEGSRLYIPTGDYRLPIDMPAGLSLCRKVTP